MYLARLERRSSVKIRIDGPDTNGKNTTRQIMLCDCTVDDVMQAIMPSLEKETRKAAGESLAEVRCEMSQQFDAVEQAGLLHLVCCGRHSSRERGEDSVWDLTCRHCAERLVLVYEVLQELTQRKGEVK